jgi:putative hydrolase of the HAD superfamily
VLEAVLFDWGDTLMQWAWEPELLGAGHAAGLAALGRAPSPELTARFQDELLPVLLDSDRLEEADYPALLEGLLADVGIDLTAGDIERFLEAEHAAWGPARQLASTTHALLETLRGLGLKLGIVSNAIDPPGLLRRDLDAFGIAARVDIAVFSSEIGLRKPHPAIFERALADLAVAASDALFVGDSLAADVAGAAAVGMHTCQALWFRADDGPATADPDFRAFTQADVLTAVRRLR